MVTSPPARASHPLWVLLLSLACLAVLIVPSAASASGRPGAAGRYGVWEPFIGTQLSTPALPDYHANYFAFAFTRSGDARYIGLRFSGRFGHARYMSFNMYRAHGGPSFGAFTDFQIQPDAGSVNPFVPGTDANATNRSYVVDVQPAGPYPTDSQANTLTFDPLQVRTLVVILRYYVPQGGMTADVPLPKIEAYDVRTQHRVRLPKQYSIAGRPTFLFAWVMRPIFSTIVDDTLRFYHAVGVGVFPNADNQYLIDAVTRKAGEMLVLRFKPPTFPQDNSEYGATQVRYWSLNEGNRDTSTAFGMRDDQFKVASDGYVYVAIGGKGLRRPAEQRGYNFMPWRIRGRTGVIVYRNLVTDPSFPGRISGVPILDLSNQQNIYAENATNFIGGYAPTGVKVSNAQFLENGGGIVPPRP